MKRIKCLRCGKIVYKEEVFKRLKKNHPNTSVTFRLVSDFYDRKDTNGGTYRKHKCLLKRRRRG